MDARSVRATSSEDSLPTIGLRLVIRPVSRAFSLAALTSPAFSPCCLVGGVTRLPSIQADWSGIVREHEQEAARDRDVLEKHEHLILIRKIVMKYKRGEHSVTSRCCSRTLVPPLASKRPRESLRVARVESTCRWLTVRCDSRRNKAWRCRVSVPARVVTHASAQTFTLTEKAS
jgi:hypothetical protein